MSESPPFEVPHRLKELLEIPGFLGVPYQDEALSLYWENSINFNYDRDLSSFGRSCLLGSYEKMREEFQVSKPDLRATETSYGWSYVALAAVGSKWFIFPGARFTPYARIIVFLTLHGAPVDTPDIAGLTALSHVAMNNLNREVVRTLLNRGANPNSQDKFGLTPLHYAFQSNGREAAELCLRHGGNLDIRDGKGLTPKALGWTTDPRFVHLVCRDNRKREGSSAPLEEKVCAMCGGKATTQCSRCWVARYCGTRCQSIHCKGGHKMECTPFGNDDTTAVCKPTYPPHVDVCIDMDPHERMGQPGGKPKQLVRLVHRVEDECCYLSRKQGKCTLNSFGNHFIITAELPPCFGPTFPQSKAPKFTEVLDAYVSRGVPIWVYNKSRKFVCSIFPNGQPSEYRRLAEAIRSKGYMGLKGYFIAELENRDRLKIKVGEILAVQPW